ncbi:MAG: protein-glutamate O-methyltransferase CheR [Deltaproteobacteria bacterium]|nr:protein-glutamate O-methyltransferase CheR [Deltaproteobacteria bacterium]
MKTARSASPQTEEDLPLILDKLYFERGWDFRDYKATSLKRMLLKRLSALNVPTYKDYLDILEKDPEEYNELFSCLMVKVSEFFREPEAFSYLHGELPRLTLSGQGLKAWCAACATGEEAYSLAMLFTESLSPESLQKTKVYATDICPGALDSARKAVYRDESLVNVSPAMKEKYFFPHGHAHKVKYSIRNLVRFGCHDLVKDWPLAKVDVLFCRNLFIYFNKPLQDEVFKKLDSALKKGGVLALGKAEVLPQPFSSSYSRLGPGANIYRKTG